MGWRMIALRIHAKAESRQRGPLFIMFSDQSRMFHLHEKYDSDFTDTLSGFRAGMQGVCVCVCVCGGHKWVKCVRMNASK